MNIFRSIAEWYKRARHTRGYGVHSPFVYSMVCRLLLSREWGWYAESEIEREATAGGARGADSESRDVADALRFYRICVDIDGDIYVPRSAPAGLRAAARKAVGRRHKVVSDSRRLADCRAAWSADAAEWPLLYDAMAGGKLHIAMLHGRLEMPAADLLERSGATLLLQGPRNSLLFRREGMQPVAYTVNY